MSRQRFPCCDRDGHDKRSRLRLSLVKARRFHATTKNFSVVIGNFMLRKSLAKTKGFYVAIEGSQN